MATNRYKGTHLVGGFLALPYIVLQSPSFVTLTPYAVKLMLDMGSQYRGDNNGDLSLAWKLMKARGWVSPTTLHKAKREVVEAGFLFETRKGHRPNKCSLYALTWLTLDPSPKHDPGARDGYVRNAFKLKEPMPKAKPGKNDALTTPRGQ